MNGSVNPLLREYRTWNPLNDRKTATVSAIPPPHRNQGGKYRPDSPSGLKSIQTGRKTGN